ncbi:PPR1 [Candida oxycetoniae]|uniref:PPR1 n=1 Tax=Candida oxycetoniae TaxID=497107 RepID=A0AAI9WXB5_9ASCO|nr:PPR1 [Candida oxycetoniae]KAI3404141.2 PPR1 [Candida oxycetoniae]
MSAYSREKHKLVEHGEVNNEENEAYSSTPKISRERPTKKSKKLSVVIKSQSQTQEVVVESKIPRAISACRRCRSKKIKCDQKFPKCGKCAMHNVECIGVDTATGREIPRSYIVHLEERVRQLEEQLNRERGGCVEEDPRETSSTNECGSGSTEGIYFNSNRADNDSISFSKLMSTAFKVQRINEKKNNIVDEVVQQQQQQQQQQQPPLAPPPPPALQHQHHHQNNISDEEGAAVLPPKTTALLFCQIFFHQCNPQTAIFHREEFIRDVFIPIYGPVPKEQFNLGSNDGAINEFFWKGYIEKEKEEDASNYWFNLYKNQFSHMISLSTDKNPDIKKISNSIVPPKRYHKPLYFLNIVFAIATSVYHLRYPSDISESFRLAAMNYYDEVRNGSDQLMALQGILLYAFYSIMRPTNPGVWYIMGEALRMCVDLDLQNELKTKSKQNVNIDPYTRDKRRRIFWCTYCIDRQICFYFDRPFGIPDESINTPLPTILDDSKLVPNDHITKYANEHNGGVEGGKPEIVSFKTVFNAFIAIRKIQSEVTKILYTGSEIPRQYENSEQWKTHILLKLNLWLQNLPTPQQMNCDFNPIFFRLNYNHTLLYIHGLGPKNFNLSSNDFRQVSIASKEIIDCYTELFLTKSINYTWAAVHNLFMAGTSFLYAVYNSEEIRKMNPLGTMKYFVSNCLQILQSLEDKCDAASYCCEIFRNLTLVIIKLKYRNTKGRKKKEEEEEDDDDEGEEAGVSVEEEEVVGKGEGKGLKISRESLYRINNGNVHFNLFSLVTELDSLNPLNSPKKTQEDVFNGQQAQHLDGHSRGKFDAVATATATATALDTLSTVATSPYPRLDKLEWNDSDLEYFLKELDHYPSSERSSPAISKEGKMTFELMHNMPNEKIWDEFFTLKY